MMSNEQKIGPMVLSPMLVERIWGETSLEPWFAETGLAKPIGEAWLTSVECQVMAGPLAGKTLAQVVEEKPEVFGEAFPLLIKVLFPREKLSVQVHPNDAQAAAAGLPLGKGKTECWYVLSAEPGATVAVGFREPLTTGQIRAAIEDGTLEDKMAHLPVKAGDMVFVDAGTVHAIGPGVVILETQQYSDVTYRLFDYGRPRELHLDKGLAVTRTDTDAGVVEARVKDGLTELVSCEYFTVDRFEVSGDDAVSLGCEGELQVLIALAEGVSLLADGGDVVKLPLAHAVVVPGEGVGYRLMGNGEVVRARV